MSLGKGDPEVPEALAWVTRGQEEPTELSLCLQDGPEATSHSGLWLVGEPAEKTRPSQPINNQPIHKQVASGPERLAEATGNLGTPVCRPSCAGAVSALWFPHLVCCNGSNSCDMLDRSHIVFSGLVSAQAGTNASTGAD